MFPLLFFFFFNDTATTEIYTAQYTLSLHDALPISLGPPDPGEVQHWCGQEHAVRVAEGLDDALVETAQGIRRVEDLQGRPPGHAEHGLLERADDFDVRRRDRHVHGDAKGHAADRESRAREFPGDVTPHQETEDGHSSLRRPTAAVADG